VISIFGSDLDGDSDIDDSDIDIVTSNFLSHNISVLFNQGDGTFSPYTTYDVGINPVQVFGADLDGDNDVDLATANLNTDNISILLNNGDGTFAPHVTYPVADSVVSVFAADLDGDGDLDLTAANYGSNNISILLNNGDGTFAPHTVYPVCHEPRSVFAADFDDDGDLDIAVAHEETDNVAVLMNQDATGFDSSGELIPIEFSLNQNRPNPFNASTIIKYELPGQSQVRIDIYNILGRKVETLCNESQQAGYHQAVWNSDGHSSGVYFYRIQTGEYCEAKKMILLK